MAVRISVSMPSPQALSLAARGDPEIRLGSSPVLIPTLSGDYETLENKPSIEGHELSGDSTLPEIGVETMTAAQVSALLTDE